MVGVPQHKTVRERVEDAMREVGTLLIAFAPLDAAFNAERSYIVALLLIFLSAGALLFTGAIALEWRRTRAR